MRVLKITYIIVSISLIYSCNQAGKDVVTENPAKSTNLLDTAKWFIGTWENHSADGLYTESWNLKNDSVYEGLSTVVVNQKDTVFYESITLEQKLNNVYYNVSVKDQNHGEPVSFKLTTVNAKQLVFENPGHDFPSKITYNRIKADSLVASISGIVDGKEKAVEFPMKKIK